MSIIHTITLANERRMSGTVSATRKSENRRYAACVTATATEETVRIDEASKAADEAKLVELRAALAEAVARVGVSEADARKWYEAAAARWYDGGSGKDAQGFLATVERVRKEKGLDDWRSRNEVERLARIDCAARGIEDPYAKGGKWDVVHAADEVERLDRDLKRRRPIVIGAEGVLGWCGSVALAQKATGARTAAWHSARGYKITIRTDITVRETVKRAPKNL
jgi:hypothetical protein